VLCDLDRFKAINDTYGHPAGDAVLRGIADVLRNSVRDSDVVARLGGDEFGMILIDADPTGATQRMGPLRTILDGFLIVHDDHYIPVSGSLGYAAYGPNSDAPTVTALADKALYRSKERR
jgi:diguanylate cyclase (GGDEF)-like protein